MAPRPGATARPKPRKKAKQKGDEVKHERALVSSVLDQMMEKQNRQLEQERDKQDAMVSAEEAQRKKREQRKVAKVCMSLPRAPARAPRDMRTSWAEPLNPHPCAA